MSAASAVLAAGGVQVAAQVHPAVQAGRHAEPASGVGRVVQRAVGIHARDPQRHTASRLVRSRRASQIGQDAVGLIENDPRLGGLGQPAGRHSPGDHTGVRCADLSGGEGRRSLRKLLEPPPGRYRRRRQVGSHPAAAAQPGLHRDSTVAPVRLPPVSRPDGRRQRSGHPVARGHQAAHEVEQRVLGQLVEVDPGELVEGGQQLGHHALPPLGQPVDTSRLEWGYDRKAQVNGHPDPADRSRRTTVVAGKAAGPGLRH
jgi:hypothetical protein